jgi:hypothetical protein
MSPRCDQLIQVNEVANEREQLEKGLEEAEEEKIGLYQKDSSFSGPYFKLRKMRPSRSSRARCCL